MQRPTTAATPAQLDALAADLRRAEAQRAPVPPITDRHPGLTIADAYAVQQANTRARIADGQRLVGHKVGLTSLAMQRQLGVNEPDFGVLFDSMVDRDGAVISRDELIAPRIEAEIAFVLGERLAGPDVTLAQARAAVDSVVLAAEIIDSRIADWRITLADTVADNASSARAVVGPTLKATPDLLASLAAERVELLIDGEPAAEGLGEAVLGDPLEAVVWLARTLDAYGAGIEAGQLVLAGAVHASVPLNPGTSFTVRSDRLPQLTGSVR